MMTALKQTDDEQDAKIAELEQEIVTLKVNGAALSGLSIGISAGLTPAAPAPLSPEEERELALETTKFYIRSMCFGICTVYRMDSNLKLGAIGEDAEAWVEKEMAQMEKLASGSEGEELNNENFPAEITSERAAIEQEEASLSQEIAEQQNANDGILEKTEKQAKELKI